ncbi:MAG: hypothetical protein H6657_13615 [Ardenticatenaceae bacterium]|nr:hypothetical protein [Ardenticatenaceae bacterium]
MNREQRQEIRDRLVAAYEGDGLWGVTNPAWPLPDGVVRGSDLHLAYLTLVYTISGGREPQALWEAARQTFAEDAELFDPHYLAYTKPATLVPRLKQHGLSHKPTSEATTWQRIGQALVMRAGGTVTTLLADHEDDALQLLAMLANSKTTFPVLSGPQTAPRWLYGLTAVGQHPLKNSEQLTVPVSPAATKALEALDVPASKISAIAFEAADALGRYGCSQRKPSQMFCPAAPGCPVASFCQYGTETNPN